MSETVAGSPRLSASVRGAVFLVQDIDALGGSERQAMSLARALAARELEVIVVTCTVPGLMKRSKRPWVEVRDGVRLYRVPLLLFESAAAAILQRHTQEWEVIYAVGIMMGAIGARLSRMFGAPLVVKLACSGAWGDMAALAGQPEAVRNEVKRDLASAHLVCLTEDIAREAHMAGFPPERLVRLPNGVDRRVVAAATPVYPLGADVPTILFAGRLDVQKGAYLLLCAFAKVHHERPDVQLLVAGAGPKGDELRTVARELKIAGAVHFLGRREDVWGLLRGATLCCLPSRGEGMSNTLLETLAAGTPVVASRISANVEVLMPNGDGDEQGIAGLLVPPEDIDELAEALLRLLGDPVLRERLSTAGRERVRGTYDMEAVATAHAELFSGLSSVRRPGLVRLAGRFVRARGHDLKRGLRRLVS